MTNRQADELLAQLKAINESLGRIAAALEKPAIGATVTIDRYGGEIATLPEGLAEVIEQGFRRLVSP